MGVPKGLYASLAGVRHEHAVAQLMTERSLPHETLSPLGTLVDRALAAFGYEMAPLIDAVDEAIPGPGGLLHPKTTPGELRDALEQVLDSDPEISLVNGDQAPQREAFVLYVDGSSRGNPGAAGAGAVILTEAEETLVELGRPVGIKAGNNTAEYAALHLGVDQLVRRYRPAEIEVRTDSTTVATDVWGNREASQRFEKYTQEITTLLDAVSDHEWTHLSDSESNPADRFATVGADLSALGP